MAGGGSRGGGEAGGREARWEEKDLLAWLRRLRPHGTLVLIYNLWETDQGLLELDLFSDLGDRGAEVRHQHATTATPTT